MKEKSKFIKIILIFLTIIMLIEALYLLAVLKGGLPQDKRIALIEIKGLILKSEKIIRQLNRYKDNPLIPAFILRIDSPGGTTGAIQEIYQEIMKIRKKGKIFVSSFENIAASGAYYISTACNYILSNPGTLTGSIGVAMEVHNYKKILDKIGLKAEIIKSGEYKDIGSPLREMTPKEREIFQELTNNVHKQFIEAVLKGRKISKEKLSQIADGRIFTGETAYKLGLVDKLGNLNDAIKIAAKLAKIKGKPIIIRSEDRLETTFKRLFQEIIFFKEFLNLFYPYRLWF